MMNAFPTGQALGQTLASPVKAMFLGGVLANDSEKKMRPGYSPVFPGMAADSRMFPNRKLPQNVTPEAFGEKLGGVSC
jgi:hypothetical protein